MRRIVGDGAVAAAVRRAARRRSDEDQRPRCAWVRQLERQRHLRAHRKADGMRLGHLLLLDQREQVLAHRLDADGALAVVTPAVTPQIRYDATKMRRELWQQPTPVSRSRPGHAVRKERTDFA